MTQWHKSDWRKKPRIQMPDYTYNAKLAQVEAQLSQYPPLVFAGEALQGDLQMDVALAPQDDFVGVAVLLPVEAGVFFEEFGEGAAELDFVAAVFGCDRQCIHRL